MNHRQPAHERLTEIREALMHTDWRSFDRDDVQLLMDEVERLRAEQRSASAEEAKAGLAA